MNFKNGQFVLEGRKEILLWAKYQFWKAGIPPEEFRKTRIGDLKDIMDIENAIEEKSQRNQGIQDALSRMGKTKW
jgi:hypothetical protein